MAATTTKLRAFIWEARTRTGDVKKGVMEADSEEAVHNKLKMQQLSPTLVKKQPKQLTLPSIGTGVNPGGEEPGETHDVVGLDPGADGGKRQLHRLRLHHGW